MEATTTITATVGATFTHSAWVEGDTPGTYDVEVGPRLTFRRVPAPEVRVGDLLMDAFGQPSVVVKGRRATTRTVRLTFQGHDAHQTFGTTEVLNVFVSRQEVGA